MAQFRSYSHKPPKTEEDIKKYITASESTTKKFTFAMGKTAHSRVGSDPESGSILNF